MNNSKKLFRDQGYLPFGHVLLETVLFKARLLKCGRTLASLGSFKRPDGVGSPLPKTLT